MRHSWKIAIAILLVATGPALAQEPKFEFGKQEDVKKVEWKASAQLGLILTAGNSRQTALSASAAASRKAGDNKLGLEASFAFARSSVLVASDADMNGAIGPAEIVRTATTTANNWNVKLRYDRFFAEHNSAYASAHIGADRLAGKELMGGGQVGYSRQAFKTDAHEIVAEAGYDFTYESYIANVDALAIHSARLFAGWTAKLSEVTGLAASLEALMNLNRETGAAGDIATFEDTRLLGKAALTTKVWSRVDFRFSVTVRFDNAPAPLPPFKVPYEAGFVPLAEKTDFTAEGALIVNIL